MLFGLRFGFCGIMVVFDKLIICKRVFCKRQLLRINNLNGTVRFRLVV